MIAIRRARPSDAAAIGAVHVAAWRTTYPGILPNDFLSRLSARRQAAVLDVVTRHAVGPSSPRAAPSAADLVPSATRALPPSPAPTSPGAERRAGSGAGVVRIECAFAGGPAAVEVRAAPPKAAARMREKLCEYAPPHPAATWPLCGNILDPVRASVVCSGAAQMLEVIIAARRRQLVPRAAAGRTARWR